MPDGRAPLIHSCTSTADFVLGLAAIGILGLDTPYAACMQSFGDYLQGTLSMSMMRVEATSTIMRNFDFRFIRRDSTPH
jgi:hypothetical protein